MLASYEKRITNPEVLEDWKHIHDWKKLDQIIINKMSNENLDDEEMQFSLSNVQASGERGEVSFPTLGMELTNSANDSH